MDAVVQFIRNGLCCIKDLGWFRTSVPSLWNAKTLQAYYELPEPINKTTPLDLMICITQFYASVSLGTSGWTLFHTSYGKFVRIRRLLDTRMAKKSLDDTADRLINVSLVKEAAYAMRSMFIGIVIFSIGGAFFWLAANSLHIPGAGYMGGTEAVIHALTVAEVGLLPLLYYMWKDSKEQFQKANRMHELSQQIKEAASKSGTGGTAGGGGAKTCARRLNSSDMDLASFEVLTNWLPFWDSGVSIFDRKVPDSALEEKMVSNERLTVLKLLKEYTDEVDPAAAKKKDDDKKEQVDTSHLLEKAEELVHASRITRLEGYREIIFFILNSIAFYSYMLCIVVFYFSDEDTKPYFIKSILFGLDNASADWHGNFWGDLMWTIEPIVLLSSQMVFASMRSVPLKEADKKVKND